MMAVFMASKAIPAYAGDFTTAATLPTNGTWSGKCELAEKATDYYKFTITTAGEIDLKLMSYAHLLTYSLYDSNFDPICTARAGGSENSPETKTINQWLSQGTYYVSVSSSYGNGGISYKLYASFATSGLTAADTDSYDSPQIMKVNSKAAGVLTYSNNVDWYTVTISTAGKYQHFFQYSDSFRCYLYDANLSTLDTLFRYGTNTDTQEIELKPGTYYIKINGYTPSICGTYTYQLVESLPAKGDILTDSKTQAHYKVTKAGKSGGTVTYQNSINGMKPSITIPSTVKIDNITYKVTGIAPDAFKGNSMLKKVTIGSNVVSIGKNAFRGCRKLKTLKIGNNVTSIGDDSFHGCTSLKTVTIPSKVAKIGKQTFYGCKKLKTLKINTKKLTNKNVGNKAFAKIDPKAKIKVPASCLKPYKKFLPKKGLNGKTQKILK